MIGELPENVFGRQIDGNLGVFHLIPVLFSALPPYPAVPRQIHISPAEMAIGRRLPVNGPAQVQAPDDPAGVREKFFSISSTIFSSGMAAVPKVFTLMDTGRATPMA